MKPTLRTLFLFSLAAAAAGVPACAKTSGNEGTDSNTHWLATCTTDSDCGGLECYCGVCTERCTTKAACAGFRGAPYCALPEGCAEQNESACLAACTTDDDCRAVSPAGTTLVCHSGQCVAAVASMPATPQPVPCSATTEDGDPCTGDATCERPCVGGYAGRLYCSDGHWLAGLGLFPCGSDAGTTPPVTEDGGPVRPRDAAPGSSKDAMPAGSSDAEPTIHTNCLINSDCSLASDTCCGPCDTPDQVVAVANYSVDAVHEARCTAGEHCTACVPPPSLNVQAVCVDEKCATTNIHLSAVCLRDEDCVLAARNCCQCSGFAGSYQLAAVNSTHLGEFQQAMCYSTDLCQCEPAFPDWAHARCNPGTVTCQVVVDPGH